MGFSDTALESQIPRLRRYARALTRNIDTADDLVQDTLARALAKRHLWQEGTDLRAWLFTMVHNNYVNSVRKAVREGMAVEVSESLPAFDRTDASTENDHLSLALSLLPSEQRIVIELVGLDGFRYEDVAIILGVPVGTVRSRLSRGRDLLRQLLRGVMVGEPGYNGKTLRSIVVKAKSKQIPVPALQPTVDEWPEELVDDY